MGVDLLHPTTPPPSNVRGVGGAINQGHGTCTAELHLFDRPRYYYINGKVWTNAFGTAVGQREIVEVSCSQSVPILDTYDNPAMSPRKRGNKFLQFPSFRAGSPLKHYLIIQLTDLCICGGL